MYTEYHPGPNIIYLIWINFYKNCLRLFSYCPFSVTETEVHWLTHTCSCSHLVQPGVESVPDSKSMLFLQNFAILIHYTFFAKSGSPEGFRIKSLKLPWLLLSAKNKKTNEKKNHKNLFLPDYFFHLTGNQLNTHCLLSW